MKKEQIMIENFEELKYKFINSKYVKNNDK